MVSVLDYLESNVKGIFNDNIKFMQLNSFSILFRKICGTMYVQRPDPGQKSLALPLLQEDPLSEM